MEDTVSSAVRLLLEATSRSTGTEFISGLARAIARALSVKAGFVGVLAPNRQAIRTLAVWWDDAFVDNFEYELAGTPCEGVVGHAPCFFPDRVQQLFPSDKLLVEMGVHSYLGIPINGTGGNRLGLLVALNDAPTPQFSGYERDYLEPIFQLFADRAGVELERLAAHEKLQASEERYRRIVSQTQDGVWMLDPQGRTTFANAQLARMLGWAPDELLGRPLKDFMTPARWEEAEQRLARRARGISERHEFCFQRKDGSELWTVLSTSPLTDDAGEYIGSLALVADLTEVRSLGQKIVQGQKLESLGLLAGGVAHDFNNLLVGILGNVGIALAGLPRHAELRQPLEDAEIAAKRAADLTRQMLAYSGRGRFVVERIDLNRVVEEQAQLLGSVISKRAQLRFELARDLPGVDADATQLRQVVMNLITNASDALDGHDGVIRVATGVVDATEADLGATYLDDHLVPGVYVYVDVTDTGVGMDAATRARIFDPFFTTKFTGRGLGLAAVLGILRGHRGAVNIQSAPGKGSTFRILLPRASSLPAEVTAAPPASPQARGPKLVLVVDDEGLVRSLLQRVLEADGFRVIAAANGTDAIAMFIEHAAEIDLVVVDMTMPGLTGEEVFHRLRQHRPDVRVVLSSGYDAANLGVTVGRGGFAGFLPKPWSADDLRRTVEAALGRDLG